MYFLKCQLWRRLSFQRLQKLPQFMEISTKNKMATFRLPFDHSWNHWFSYVMINVGTFWKFRGWFPNPKSLFRNQHQLWVYLKLYCPTRPEKTQPNWDWCRTLSLPEGDNQVPPFLSKHYKVPKRLITLALHPRNLTQMSKMAKFKRSHLFQTIILGIHASFWGM